MKRLCFFVAFYVCINFVCMHGAEFPRRQQSVRDLANKIDPNQRFSSVQKLIQKVENSDLKPEEKIDTLQLLSIASTNEQEKPLYKNGLRVFGSDIPQLSPHAAGETDFYVTTYPTLPLSDSLPGIIGEKKAEQIIEIKKNILGTKKSNFNYRIKRDDEKIDNFLKDPNSIHRAASQPLIDKLIKQQVDTVGKKINEDPNPTPGDRQKDLNLLDSYTEKTSNLNLQQDLKKFIEDHTPQVVQTPEDLGIVVEEAGESEAAPLTFQQEPTANRSENSPDSTLVLWQKNPVVQQAQKYYQQNESQVDAKVQPQSPRKQPKEKIQKKVVVPKVIKISREPATGNEAGATAQVAADETKQQDQDDNASQAKPEESNPGPVEVDYESIPNKGNLFNDYGFPQSIQSEWKSPVLSEPEKAWSLSDFMSRMWSGIKSWRWW